MVQRFLNVNRESLEEMGILFPRAPGKENQMGLAAAAQRTEKRDDLRLIYKLDSTPLIDSFRQDLTRGIRDEITRSRAGICVMSGEHCSSRLVEIDEIQTLHDMLRGNFSEIKILVYVRRQDDFLLSTYSTAIKSGRTEPFKVPGHKQQAKRYDYWHLLQQWSSVFGRENIICRIYGPDILVNGDIVDDFCDVIGISNSHLARMMRPKRLNESLDAIACEFLRMFNAHMPRFTTGGINPARGGIENLLSKVCRGPKFGIEASMLHSFMSQFRHTNELVASEYFGGPKPRGGDPLFGADEDSKPSPADQNLDLDKAMKIFAMLWSEKQEQLVRLERRLEKIMKHNNSDPGNQR